MSLKLEEPISAQMDLTRVWSAIWSINKIWVLNISTSKLSLLWERMATLNFRFPKHVEEMIMSNILVLLAS